VPLGTLIGQQTSWRVPLLLVAVLASVAAVAVRMFVRPVAREATRVVRRPVDRTALLFALVTTVVGFGSQFIVFTFLAEFLHLATGIDPGLISLPLLVFGSASAIGTAVGGRAADRWPSSTL